jgi:hypothetical protein
MITIGGHCSGHVLQVVVRYGTTKLFDDWQIGMYENVGFCCDCSVVYVCMIVNFGAFSIPKLKQDVW